MTHDLAEAVRIGRRIAIVKDGRLVQTGTPEETVSRRADGRVRAIFQTISRPGVITARSAMEPLGAQAAPEIAAAPRCAGIGPSERPDRAVRRGKPAGPHA